VWHVLVAGAGTLVVAAVLFFPGVLALFMGTYLSTAYLIGWWLVLAGFLDVVHRRAAVRDGPRWALLQSLLAAGLAVAASALLFVTTPAAWFTGLDLVLLPGAQACVVLAVVSLGRVARSRADEGAPRWAAAGMGLGASAVVALIAAIWIAVQVPSVPAQQSSAIPPAVPQTATTRTPPRTAVPDASLHATAPGPEGHPISTVAAARPCTPADLAGDPVGIDRAVGSAGLATVQVTSTSDAACYVEGLAENSVPRCGQVRGGPADGIDESADGKSMATSPLLGDGDGDGAMDTPGQGRWPPEVSVTGATMGAWSRS
jgi:hypothetical protein